MHLRRKLPLMLSLIPTLLFAAGGSITSGIAPAIGDGSEDMSIGFNLEGTAYGEISKYVSMGAKLGFNRWSVDLDEVANMYSMYTGYGIELEGALTYLELSPVLRITLPISEKATYFFEPSSGFYLGIAKVNATMDGNTSSDSNTEPAFGFSFATGFDISHFEIKPAFKMIVDEGETGKWFALTAGVAF